MFTDIEWLKAKVPRICPSTAGVPARREGRYSKQCDRDRPEFTRGDTEIYTVNCIA